MKILLMGLNRHPGLLGGGQTFVRNIKKMFPKESYFISFMVEERKYFEINDNIEVNKESFKFKILRKFLGIKVILKHILNNLEYDICILNSPKELRYMRKDSKKILVQHMNYDIYINSHFKNNKKLIEKAKKELDYFVFLSEYDKERFIKEISFPREKSIAIRHTCELEILNKAKEKNKNLIMICRLDNKQKRIDLAIKAMKKLEDFNLNIYGNGMDKDFLEKVIEESKLTNVFLYEGTKQVKEKLDENSIFIMTSDTEGYGITNIEAMRRGLPIILRNTFDAAPDIVENNGILLDKEWDEDKFVRAVNKIYANYEYYSKNSIKMGKRHDFEVIKKEWSKLFKNCINNYN